MALTPILIIERRRNALIAQWKHDRGQGAGVGAVGRRSQTNTVIVSRVGGDPDRNASSPTGFRRTARTTSAASLSWPPVSRRSGWTPTRRARG